ncbi:MAG TPA: PAS domain-containing sensor histidine kinase [Rhizomicrobium sp.]|nr:PAS domain-containing sensor histidine kinase [Rhizomicrobium sp.]
MPAEAGDEKRKNASEAYRLLAEESSDIVVVYEPDGEIYFASSALQRVLMRSPGEFSRSTLLHIVHPEDGPTAMAVMAIPPPAETLNAIFRVRHGDGRYIWLEMTARGIYDTATGELRNVITVSRDITDRVQRELDIKAAQERAESANKAKSRFLANMSHELRTPLNAVIGFTDMMRQQTLGPLGNKRYEEYATLIYDSGQLLLDLISDMLDMAKIEAGKLELNLENVDFNGTVEDCARLLRDRAENSGLEFTLSLPKEPAFATADKRAVKQIMLNLLSNAIKFTPAGGEVGVSVRAGDGVVTICVRDSGIGIPESDLERLGNPFEQVNGDPMLAKSGSGLGLALVRALVEKHGGSLKIASEEGVGTEVKVTFPVQAKSRAAA